MHVDPIDRGVRVRVSGLGGGKECESSVHDGDDERAKSDFSIGVTDPDSGKLVWIEACVPCWAEAVVTGLRAGGFSTIGKTLVLYHRTSRSAAETIGKQGRFLSRERDEVCFSNRESGRYSVDYGEATVRVEVPEVWTTLDDEFEDGEQHYRVNARDIKPAWITGVMLPR